MKIVNRKARFNYELLEKIEAGVVLTGAEVKSVKGRHINLENSFVRIRNGEAFLTNAHIPPYPFAQTKNYEPTRERKLLLHKKEALAIEKKMEGRGLALIPIACYTKKGKIKIALAMARGKKQWQKKELIKRKDLEREAQQDLKEFR